MFKWQNKEYKVSTDALGYKIIKVDKKAKRVHRLVLEKKSGKPPKGHISVFLDGDKQNVSPDNLAYRPKGKRHVADKEIEFHNGTYYARVTHKNKRYWLGSFPTRELAGKFRRDFLKKRGVRFIL